MDDHRGSPHHVFSRILSLKAQRSKINSHESCSLWQYIVYATIPWPTGLEFYRGLPIWRAQVMLACGTHAGMELQFSCMALALPNAGRNDPECELQDMEAFIPADWATHKAAWEAVALLARELGQWAMAEATLWPFDALSQSTIRFKFWFFSWRRSFRKTGWPV